MATNTSKVFIDIITQFTGTKSIKQAETSFDKLAKSIGRVVSVAAIEEFSRASIKAFLADNAAANQLIKTLDNLGIAFNPGSLDAYIQNLQNTTGVLDDQLRPAFAQLAVATKDYTTSQSLLSTALDVSQGTGKSLSAVTTALSKAYLGNFAAISRLGAGISKAQIKAGNFNDIQKTLNQNFGGAALAAADTYAGKLRIVGAAFNDVKETIGKGFVDAFSNLVGENGSATKFASSLRDSAQYIADIIVGLSVIGTKLSALPGAGIFKELANISKQFSGINLIANLGKTKRVSGIANDSYSRQKQLLVSQTKSLAVSKELVKATTAQTKANKDKLAAEKASLVLKTAAKVLDVDQAQILAALSRNLSEDEQNRLKLQQALLNDNYVAAGKLAQTIIASQEAALLAEKMNPFGSWNDSLQIVLDSLKTLSLELAGLGAKTIIPSSGSLQLALDASNAITDSMNLDFIDVQNETDAAKKMLDDALAASKKVSDQLDGLLGGTTAPPIDYSFLSGYKDAFNYAPGNQTQTINLVVDGQILTSVVTNGQQNTSASGVSPAVSRINPYSSGF
jgi:hypothetical protein